MSFDNRRPTWEPIFVSYGGNSFYEDLDLLEKEKNKERFIKDIERIIRTSIEYREYIKYLKTEALLTQCVALNMLPEDLNRTLSVEMHHCPLTLYDLVDIVLTKYLVKEETFTRITIANEIMDAHFMNQIGLVPMTVTMHQLIHSGKDLVHKGNVFGDYRKFANYYEAFLSDNHKDKLERFERLTPEYVTNVRNNVLQLSDDLFIEHDDIDDDVVYLSTNDSETPSNEITMEMEDAF